ncbi:MAG: lysophospholipid acyltransferase family protein [Pseudomonadota bacterium]
MKGSLFAGDTYTTPPGKEKLLHKLLMRWRAYYILRVAAVVFGYWPIARKGGLDQQNWHNAAFDIFKALEDCGGRFHITGLDNLRKIDGPVVFVANHMSTLETLVPPAFMYPYKKPVYVVKEQLLTVPFFGAYVQKCIGVTRNHPAEDFKQVMLRGADKISQGYSIIIFPQATRSMTFDPAKFNSLGVKLAKRCKVPVIPVAFKTDFWGTGRLVKDFGPLSPDKTIFIDCGEPIEIHGTGKEEHEQIMTFIKERLAGWSRSAATA